MVRIADEKSARAFILSGPRARGIAADDSDRNILIRGPDDAEVDEFRSKRSRR